MKKKWLYLFTVMMMAPLLSACDGGNSAEMNVVPPNNSDNGGNNGGDDGGDDGGNVTPPDAPCAGKEYGNALTAIKNHDASKASEAELLAYSQCILDLNRANPFRQQAISAIYQGMDKNFSWDPGRYSHFFSVFNLSSSFPILGINNDDRGNQYSLAVAGEQDGQRYIALAENPVLSTQDDAPGALWMKNMVSWLTESSSVSRSSYELAGKGDEKLHVVVAQMKNRADDGSYSAHYDGIKHWLDTTFPGKYSLNDANSCDYDSLNTCLSTQPVDLLIVGDRDKEKREYDGIRTGIEYARTHKIPLMTMASDFNISPIIIPLYMQMGITAAGNYFSTYTAVDYPIAQLLQVSANELAQSRLLANLKTGNFDPAVFDAQDDVKCQGSVLGCSLPAFKSAFGDGADVYRNALTLLDQNNINVLKQADKYPLLAAGVLLADKYRQQIDYPVSAVSEPALFQKGMFADWVVNYARNDNVAQPDLGEYAVKAKEVVKGQMASFNPGPSLTDSKTFTIPYPQQWTASGWYAPAGKPVTITSTADSARVVIQLGAGYTGVYQSAGNKTLVAPSEVSMKDTTRLVLAPGKSITFSTPYGGPVYVRFTDVTLTHASLSAEGVSVYSALLDFNDNDAINTFDGRVANSEIPYVDIKSTGLELHMLKFRFTDALGSNDNPDITTTAQLVAALKDYYTWVYTLGGFKIQGKSLLQSLPADDLAICSGLFGAADCTDENLHTRTLIQHVLYDQRSRCIGGSGCSGNPFDTSWAVAPYGWGENHELGHNLQINPLNVAYVDDDKKEIWTNYGSRAGEVSNNIFPYHTLWQHSWSDGKTAPIKTGHGNPLEVYSVAMSELRDLKNDQGQPVIYNAQCQPYTVDGVTATRYTGPWQSNAYAVYNTFREAFYFQMPLQLDKQVMRGGETLQNGFNIYTLLYQHARIFGKYAANETSWNAQRDSLGFSLFPWSGEATYGGKNVQAIPGNDFMLVSLSYITNADWRPYFDMFGLHYTTLASQQVEANAFSRVIKQEVLTNKNDPQLIPNNSLSDDPSLVAVDLTDKNAQFPGVTWSCH